jgi:hypothetical protein
MPERINTTATMAMMTPLLPPLFGAGNVEIGVGLICGRELGTFGTIIAGAEDVGAGGAPYA